MTQLPNEVWLVLLGHLDRNELKAIRLTSKTLASLAVRSLYRGIILRPNAESVKRIRAIADTTHLAYSVKELYLCPETVHRTAIDIARDLTANNGEQLRRKRPDYAQVDFDKFFANRPKLNVAEKLYDNWDESQLLGKLCSLLPNLQHLERCYDPLSSLRYAPYPWRRSSFAEAYGLNIPNLYRAAFRAQNIVAACRGTTVFSLKWHPMDWGEFERDWAAHSKRADGLCPIRKLLMRFETGGPWVVPKRRLQAFDTFLRELEMIEDIMLKLDDHDAWHDHALIPLWQTVLSQQWNHIRSVCLKNLVCSESHLLAFISRNAASLKELRISYLRLHAGEDETSMGDGSVMRLIWAVPHLASLDVFELQEDAASCGSEHWETWRPWYSVKPPSKDSFYRRLQEYVCRRGPYPFPDLASLLRFRPIVASLGLPLVEWCPPPGPLCEELVAPNHNSCIITEVFDTERGSLEMRAGLISQDERWKLLEKCSDDSWRWSAPEKDCVFDVSSDDELGDDADNLGFDDDFGGETDDSLDDFWGE